MLVLVLQSGSESLLRLKFVWALPLRLQLASGSGWALHSGLQWLWL